MNDVIVEVNTKTGQAYNIDTSDKIGNQHQNLQNKLKFEFKDYIPEGIAWLEYEIDGIKNYALMERYENGYQIDIKSCLLISNHVSVDIKITQEENPNGIPVFVSTIVRFAVAETINAEEKKPDEYPDWKEAISSKLAEFESSEKVRNENEEGRKTNEIQRETNEKARKQYIKDLKQDVAEGELNGATFIPNVSTEGDLSWSNDKGLDNPETVNIRGPQGEKGDCNFATFEIDKKTGELIMNKTEDLLLDFTLNENGELEVIVNG